MPESAPKNVDRRQPGGRVFIVRDTIHARLLDEVALRLASAGAQVVRGPHEPAALTPETLVDLVGDAEVAALTVRQTLTRSHMVRLPRLNGVCLPVTGVESIDLAAASELGILVGHGATLLNSVGIAEATVMLTLASLYRLPAAQALMKGGSKPDVPRGELAMGKTIGLIGFGRIASAVADRLRPFGVKLTTHSPTTPSSRIPDYVTRVGLDELMRASDVVILLASLTPESRGMLSRRELSLMKPSAFIVNTARGALIDEEALIETLAEERISGAALDTFAVEPLDARSRLRTLPNVILTPHMIGHTREGSGEFATAMVENITRLLAGELPLHCKNPAAIEVWRARRGRGEASV